MTTADAIFQAVLDRLQNSPVKPSGLTVEPSPVFQLQDTELPYLGLTLAEGEKPAGDGEDTTDASLRACTLVAEIWTAGDQTAARPFREWLLASLFEEETMGGLAAWADCLGYEFAPAYDSEKGRVGITVVHLSFNYRWRPY